MSDNGDSSHQNAGKTQPIRVKQPPALVQKSADSTQPIRVKPPAAPAMAVAAKTNTEESNQNRGKSTAWLNWFFLAALGFFICVVLAYAGYQYGVHFWGSQLAAHGTKPNSAAQPAGVRAPANISLPISAPTSSTVQPPATLVPTDVPLPTLAPTSSAALQTAAQLPTNTALATPVSTPAGTPVPTKSAGGVITFTQAQLATFPTGPADLQSLLPGLELVSTKTYQSLADWASAADAQALSAAGEQALAGKDYRCKAGSPDLAADTSTVHQFSTSAGALKGAAIMIASVKAVLQNAQVSEATLILQNGLNIPMTIVKGTSSSGFNVTYILVIHNVVASEAVGGLDTTPAGQVVVDNNAKSLAVNVAERIAFAQ